MKPLLKTTYLILILMLFISCGSKGKNNDSQSKYKLIDLGTFNGDVSSASGINNKSVIVGGAPEGGSYINSPVMPSAFIWTDNQFRELSAEGIAYDINDIGHVVGFEPFNNAFLWKNGTLEKLGMLPGDDISYAYQINNADQIVGFSEDEGIGSTSKAVIWQDGAITSLGTPIGDTSVAYAINNNTQIVGCSGTSGQLDTTGILWDDIDVSILPRHANSNYSCAVDINDKGQLIGWSLIGAPDYGTRGYYYENGKFYDLGNIQANAINNVGQIVGGDKLYDLNENKMYELNELIDTNTFQLDQALDINDKGEIVGYGSINGSIHAFYLIPQ